MISPLACPVEGVFYHLRIMASRSECKIKIMLVGEGTQKLKIEFHPSTGSSALPNLSFWSTFFLAYVSMHLN